MFLYFWYNHQKILPIINNTHKKCNQCLIKLRLVKFLHWFLFHCLDCKGKACQRIIFVWNLIHVFSGHSLGICCSFVLQGLQLLSGGFPVSLEQEWGADHWHTWQSHGRWPHPRLHLQTKGWEDSCSYWNSNNVVHAGEHEVKPDPVNTHLFWTWHTRKKNVARWTIVVFSIVTKTNWNSEKLKSPAEQFFTSWRWF